jgi:FlaA1/EpsC-like NDP-sugar epimerase
MVFLRKNTPRWIIFSIDVSICFISISLAYLLRFNFLIPQVEFHSIYLAVPYMLLIRTLSFVISRSYAGIVRYTNIKDAERLFIVLMIGSIFFGITNIFFYTFYNKIFLIPFSIILIEFFVSIFSLTAFRLIIKTLYFELNASTKEASNVIIYGTDEYAITTKLTLDRDLGTKHNVIAFIDNTNRNVGKKLENISIYNSDKLDYLIEKFKASHLIFAKKYIGLTRKNEIIETCLNHNVKVLTVPDVNTWINGELSFNQIKNIKIENLLERDLIILDEKQIKKHTLNKTILVTGAAGSIGSEIVKQLTRFNPKNIILYDQAESPLYDLELELNELYNFKNFKTIIGDITNIDRVNYIFERYKPSFVYHAAAYKHVPMMEINPAEAVITNVLGVKIIADLSVKHKAEKFVMISTDKAVKPSNVMGASKRIAEMYIQSLNKISETVFITTRFGNVLGSNGSVIPRFKKQIENGGPVTITHPEVTRYFMTIPEACQLVLEAGAMGKGGEIFIFDMGKLVKIVDLAKKMIQLSGLTLGKDIHLKFTGLRPGEKLYEELLDDKEKYLPTHHPQIMIAQVRECDHNEFSSSVKDLIEKVKSYNNYEIVKLMKTMVPEFISNNSVFEELDNQLTVVS